MMMTLRLIRQLGPLDARSVWRDPMLRWLLVIPLAFALAARGLLRTLLERASAALPFDPLPLYDPIMGYALLVIAPQLTGMVIGFLLLDLRDDGVIEPLRITPATLSGYLNYRLALPLLLSLALSIAVFPIAGIPSGGPFGLLLAALATAPMAPLLALFLGAVAENKVQGFALVKAFGIIFIPPVVARFAPAGWQPLLAISPTYWSAQTLWALQDGTAGAWLFFAGAVIYQLALCALLLRRLQVRG